MSAIRDFKGEIGEHKLVSPKVFLTTIELVEPKEIEFSAGQYLSLEIIGGLRRSYSLASVPNIKNKIDLLVDVSPQGPGSEFFKNLKIGGKVEFRAPLGKFILEGEKNGDYLFLATGTGLAPFMAMMPVLLEASESKVNLLLGFRFLEDIFYQDKLEDLRKKHLNFNYKICLSKPGPDWKGLTGHITDYLSDYIADTALISVYLCGSKAMVDEARIKLKSLSVPEERIHFEQYY